MEIYIILGVLLTLSAICSGMTLGMMSLNVAELERKITLGDNNARKILVVRKHGSLLLCSLLLSHTAVNSAISVFMSSVTSGLIAGAISTILIVIFGEIMPQALFSRHALKYGSKMVWLVRFFMFITYPISKPISILIDKVFGQELPTKWDKKEIAEIIKDHEEGIIDSDESRIIIGALNFSDKRVKDVLTPSTEVFMIEKSEVITKELLHTIKDQAFSRIPIYDEMRDNVIGILYAKKLIGDEYSGKNITAGELCDREQIMSYRDDAKLDMVLNNLLKTKRHLSFVFNEFGTFNGIVTMEDIVEEIINVEILDESDDVADLQKQAKEKMKARFTHK